MEAISSKRERVTRITRMVSQLSAEEQTELLKRLEQKMLLEKAQKLAEGVAKNSLSMTDIVNEVRKVRQNK